MRTAAAAWPWLLLAAAATATTTAAAAIDDGAAARAVVDETNAFRGAERLAPTRANPQLAAAAQAFADFMARTDRYGHEADGRQPADRAGAQGYDWCLVAENIAYIQDPRLQSTDLLAQRFVDNWQRSPGHRRNMLDAEVTETGVALAYGERSGRWYAVQLFGRPKAAAIHFDIANRSPQAVSYDLDGERFELAPNVTRSHEQCRAAQLSLRLPGRTQPLALQPANGQHWLVEQRGGELRATHQNER